ncbi:MAG TPA: TonB C-terminal domain-containing protein [Verrucomicrobiae bacterium]|nr:TonB C-terminal domain-containing protein [Verrucomicrobiae bacterium]
MLPHTQARKKRNSSKVNLLISFTFHALIVVVGLYFAARGGLLGKQIQKISVEMVKEKQPPKPKPAEKPKVEPPKETPKLAAAPKVEPPREAPPVAGPPTVAPPAAELPSFVFEGGKTVESSSDPVQLYKGLLEYAFRSKWDRPQNLHDDDYVAEIRVTVDHNGQISNVEWLKGSGNSLWDNSVHRAIAAMTKMDSAPPTNFPPSVVIRFDVQQETEPVLQ